MQPSWWQGAPILGGAGNHARALLSHALEKVQECQVHAAPAVSANAIFELALADFPAWLSEQQEMQEAYVRTQMDFEKAADTLSDLLARSASMGPTGETRLPQMWQHRQHESDT